MSPSAFDVIPPAPNGEDAEFRLMIAGKPYLASDPYIQTIAVAQRAKVAAINETADDETRFRLAREFFNVEKDANVYLLRPFFCEYGFNVTIGDDVVLGTGLTILDVCPVTIGARTMLGPNVQIYTATHPIYPEARRGTKGREYAKHINIGKDCWIGGAALICPGVTIGDGATVGAGSVVTKDVPSRTIVAGNPARVVKTIPEPTEQELAAWK